MVAALAALVYLLFLGATAAGELSPILAGVNLVLAIPVLAAYLWRAPQDADAVDRLVLAATCTFVLACVLSQFPRQSFEAAIAAMTYAAAFFVARGMLAQSAVRAALVWILMGLSAAITLATVVRWSAFLLEWAALAGWRVFPPLNMELPSLPWGHRHDLALLVVMLYPAWWLGEPSKLRRGVALAVGVLVAAIVFVDGSRTLWLAVFGASVISGGMLWRQRVGTIRMRRWGGVAGVAAAAAIAALVLALTGLGGTLVERLGNLDSVGYRTAMWSAIVGWWGEHPLAGGGPGSFPWLLQGTGYFDTTSWAPRHPDSAPMQLLAEGGLLGMGALVLLLATLLPRLFWGRSSAATWALLTFAIASLGSNPTDFAFLVITAIVWAAYAIPRPNLEPIHPLHVYRLRRGLRLATAAGALGVAVVWLMMIVAATQYGNARTAIADRAFEAAEESLNTAAALDPGMALYVRQRGILQLVIGEPAQAIRELREATAMNPHDDLAWRSLGLAATAAGDQRTADDAFAEALRLQRSDPANLLLAAKHGAAEPDVRLTILAEAVQAWPALVYAPDWDTYVHERGYSTDQIVAIAASRSQNGLPSPELVADQGLWLAVLASRGDVLNSAIGQSELSHQMRTALITLIRCDAATTILDGAPPRELRTAAFWEMHIRDAALRKAADQNARDLLTLMTARNLDDRRGWINPLHGSDLWGYRRFPVDWPAFELLPSPTAGLGSWLDGADCAG